MCKIRLTYIYFQSTTMTCMHNSQISYSTKNEKADKNRHNICTPLVVKCCKRCVQAINQNVCKCCRHSWWTQLLKCVHGMHGMLQALVLCKTVDQNIHFNVADIYDVYSCQTKCMHGMLGMLQALVWCTTVDQSTHVVYSCQSKCIHWLLQTFMM